MALILVDDVVEIVMTWDTPLASVAQNVWHYIQTAGGGADPDDLLAAIDTMMQVAFGEIDLGVHEDFEAVLLEARQWDFVNNRFDGIGTLALTGIVGLNAGDYEPHGVAALGRIITATARRQGRTFVPGLADTSIVSGVLTPAFEADFAAYLATFDQTLSISGGSFDWCTFNVDPTSPLFETVSVAAQTVIANSLPSYLSKRKPGVGL